MKKLYVLLLLIISTCVISYAQKPDSIRVEQRMKEVQEFKMKYLAQEMQLNESQKKKFFEVYEEMCSAKKECYHDAIRLKHKLKEGKNPSDADYQNATEAMNRANNQWAETEKKFDGRLAEFLTPKQIYILKEAEGKFRAKFEEMKHSKRKERHRS